MTPRRTVGGRSRPASPRRRSGVIAGILLGLLLIGLWLYLVDLADVARILKGMEVGLLVPLGLCFILSYFLRSLRWRILVAPVERIRVSESFQLCITSYFVNFLIPLHAGEVVKSYLLKKMRGTPIAASLPSVYVDKVMDLLTVFLLLPATPFLSGEVNRVIYLASSVLALVLAVTLLVLGLAWYRKEGAVSVLERILGPIPGRVRSRAAHLLARLLDGLSSLSQLGVRLPEVAALTLSALAANVLFLWLFFYAFGVPLPALTVLVGYLLLNASFVLPAPPGFAGTLELTFVVIFTVLFGYDKNLASAVAGASHLFSAALFALLGLWSIASIGTRLSALVALEGAEGEGPEAGPRNTVDRGKPGVRKAETAHGPGVGSEKPQDLKREG